MNSSMVDLKGKKVLFFSAKAFGIPENIVKCMEENGASVDFFDERPANSFLIKALIRINRNLIGPYINRYHKNIILNTAHNKYDYIFFIKGESFSEHNLNKLLSFHPESKSIIYHWDSIANNHNAKNLIKYFDYVYSFDRNDCIQNNISFLPLFYFDEYKRIAQARSKIKYKLLFVGTVHSDRYRFISKIANQIKGYGGENFIYYFFQGRIMFWRYMLLNKEIRGINRKEVHYKPVLKDTLLQLYAESEIVIDIQHPKQTGLTLRCLEAIGAKKKLITTNKDIKSYDFYNKNNILIVERENPYVSKEFLESPYQSLPEDIYNKYSISSWVKSIFSNIK